jgi:hypothetical protein
VEGFSEPNLRAEFSIPKLLVRRKKKTASQLLPSLLKAFLASRSSSLLRAFLARLLISHHLSGSRKVNRRPIILLETLLLLAMRSGSLRRPIAILSAKKVKLRLSGVSLLEFSGSRTRSRRALLLSVSNSNLIA